MMAMFVSLSGKARLASAGCLSEQFGILIPISGYHAVDRFSGIYGVRGVGDKSEQDEGEPRDGTGAA